jgi:hypothetical protein
VGSGRFELIPPPAPTPDAAPVLEPQPEPANAAAEPGGETAPETESAPERAPSGVIDDQADEPAGDWAFTPESAEQETQLPPAEQALGAAPRLVEARDIGETPAQPGALIRAEAALEEDEPVEEVFVAAGDEDADLPPETWEQADAEQEEYEAGDGEADDAVLSPVRDDPAQQGMSWAEQARQRARLRAEAARTAPASPPPPAPAASREARKEDLLVRKAEAEWSLDDETEYSPERDWGAGWYALFLLIGGLLAAFGAWDTWQRASGAVDEAFVYGPAIAAAGVLFMAIAGWFLIKRVLAFR